MSWTPVLAICCLVAFVLLAVLLAALERGEDEDEQEPHREEGDEP